MKRLAKFAMITVLIWAIPLTLHATPVGKFTMVRGTVDITSPEGGSQIADAGFPVNVGDVVRTKSRSSAEILFEDGSVMRLARNSRIAIDEYAVGREKDRGIFKLFRGKVQSIVEKAAGLFASKRARFEIHTPAAVAGVRGTNFFTWYNQGTSGVAVREGTVYNYAANKPNQVREVNAGQSSIVVSADESPVVGTATDAELTLDDEEEGSPSAFVGDPDEDPFVPAEEPGTLVAKDNTEEIVPNVSGTATPDFELQTRRWISHRHPHAVTRRRPDPLRQLQQHHGGQHHGCGRGPLQRWCPGGIPGRCDGLLGGTVQQHLRKSGRRGRIHLTAPFPATSPKASSAPRGP